MTVSVLEGEVRRVGSTCCGTRWVVVSPFAFTDTDFQGRGVHSDSPDTRRRADSAHYHVLVPAGFLSDGASGGAPDISSAWVFHDWLYATHRFTSGQHCSRTEADRVMWKVLRNDRLRLYAWGFRMLARTNPLCAFSRAWNQSGKRGPKMLEDE